MTGWDPRVELAANCERGWDFYVGKGLNSCVRRGVANEPIICLIRDAFTQ